LGKVDQALKELNETPFSAALHGYLSCNVFNDREHRLIPHTSKAGSILPLDMKRMLCCNTVSKM